MTTRKIMEMVHYHGIPPNRGMGIPAHERDQQASPPTRLNHPAIVAWAHCPRSLDILFLDCSPGVADSYLCFQLPPDLSGGRLNLNYLGASAPSHRNALSSKKVGVGTWRVAYLSSLSSPIRGSVESSCCTGLPSRVAPSLSVDMLPPLRSWKFTVHPSFLFALWIGIHRPTD